MRWVSSFCYILLVNSKVISILSFPFAITNQTCMISAQNSLWGGFAKYSIQLVQSTVHLQCLAGFVTREMSLCRMHPTLVDTVYSVYICPTGNLIYPLSNPTLQLTLKLSTLNKTEYTGHKSNLNPDLPDNRLPYKRFLLYSQCNCPPRFQF